MNRSFRSSVIKLTCLALILALPDDQLEIGKHRPSSGIKKFAVVL
jgi:hypothetical protein